MFDVVEVAVGSAVASGGTIAFPYPEGSYSGSYVAYGHTMFSRGLQREFSQDAGKISVAFTTEITITYKGATSIPANTVVSIQLNKAGTDLAGVAVIPDGVREMNAVMIDLGTPLTLDTDGVAVAQNVLQNAFFDLTSAAFYDASVGAVVLDVPRNVIADSGGADTAVLVITGKDVYGQTMVENITLNSTTAVNGKKAFKRIDSIKATGAAVANSAFVGTGDVIGLPIFLPYTTAGLVIGDFENGTFDATLDGTLTAGVQTTPTATTGDVRGTYDPGVAMDGAVNVQLAVFLADPTYKGVTQYAG
jgi:hypothetical protein